jgi:CDP-2,3-bis-(O-geranylgeranyl)-sn-glycerol synthase
MHDAAFQLLSLLYFMLPAYAANMAPPFVRYWTGWNRPIHARLLGSHKTVVGFAVGVTAGVLVTATQAAIATPLARFDYSHWPLLGLAMGGGAMLGDSVKSFFKRQLKIAPGSRWFPFDQLDFVLGALALAGTWADLSLADVGVILLASLVGDVLVNRLAFALNIKNTPW